MWKTAAPARQRGLSLTFLREPSAQALAATAVALVVYGILRMAAARFYGQLGVDPSEVSNAAYPALLEQSVAAVAVIIVVGGFFVAWLTVAAAMIAQAVPTPAAPSSGGSPQLLGNRTG